VSYAATSHVQILPEGRVRQSDDLLGPFSPQARAFIVKFTG
jgi:hypothetical protein